MLALIKDGEFISSHAEGSRIDLDGLTIMPAQDGWEFEHFSPVEYEEYYDEETGALIQEEVKPAEFIANYELREIASGGEAPDGYYISSSKVEFIDDRWTFVNAFEEIPLDSPLERSITKRQMLLALIGAQIYDAEEKIDAAIEAIDAPAVKAMAKTDWKYAGRFIRSHTLFNDPSFLDLMQFTPEMVDALWTVAVGLPE